MKETGFSSISSKRSELYKDLQKLSKDKDFLDMEEYSPMSSRGPAELTGLGSHEVSCTWIGPPLIGPEPGYLPVIGHLLIP